jgi:hypothetical protein
VIVLSFDGSTSILVLVIVLCVVGIGILLSVLIGRAVIKSAVLAALRQHSRETTRDLGARRGNANVADPHRVADTSAFTSLLDQPHDE